MTVMVNEKEIREKITKLENDLKITEEMWDEYTKSPDPQKRWYFSSTGEKERALMRAFGIENQLYAFYLVLGKEYKFKHL